MGVEEFDFNAPIRGILHPNEKSNCNKMASIGNSVRRQIKEPDKRGSTFKPGITKCPMMAAMKTEPEKRKQPPVLNRIKPNLVSDAAKIGARLSFPSDGNQGKKSKIQQDDKKDCGKDSNSLIVLQESASELMLCNSDEESEISPQPSTLSLVDLSNKPADIQVVIKTKSNTRRSVKSASPIQVLDSPIPIDDCVVKSNPNELDSESKLCDSKANLISKPAEKISYFKKVESEISSDCLEFSKQSKHPQSVLQNNYSERSINALELVEEYLPCISASSISTDYSGDRISVRLEDNTIFASPASKSPRVELTIRKCLAVFDKQCFSIKPYGSYCQLLITRDIFTLDMDTSQRDKTIKCNLMQIESIFGSFSPTISDNFVFLVNFIAIPGELRDYVRNNFTNYDPIQLIKKSWPLIIVCKRVTNPLNLPFERGYQQIAWQELSRMLCSVSDFDPEKLLPRQQTTHACKTTATRLRKADSSPIQIGLEIPKSLLHGGNEPRAKQFVAVEKRMATRSVPKVKSCSNNLNSVILTYPFNPLASGNKTSIFQSDVFKLEPNIFLNDSLILLYLIWLEEQYADCFDVHFFNSHFYSKLDQEGAESVQKWLRQPVLYRRYWIMPINEALHWYLAIVCFPAASIGSTYDDSVSSFYSKNDFKPTTFILVLNSLNCYNRIKDHQVTDVIGKFIEAQVHELQLSIVSDWSISTLYPANIPQQTNTHDCGCFLLENVQQFLSRIPDDCLREFIQVAEINATASDCVFPPWYPISNGPKKRRQLKRLLDELVQDPRNKNQLHYNLDSEDEIEELSEDEYFNTLNEN